MCLFNNRAAMIKRGRQQAGHAPSMRPMKFHFETCFATRTGPTIASA
jgi:hypothetical protein